MSKRARSPGDDPVFDLSLYTSNSITDRSSKFIAYYSPQISHQHLQELPELSSATHRIAAWRKSSAQRSLGSQPIYDTGYDDDGEKFAGKTLEKILVATGSVGAIVVARWYGGVLLGPARFDHIRKCAQDAISKWRTESTRPAKRMKMQDDPEKKNRLAATLKERDASIAVLRELLKQKKEQDSASPGATPQAKAMDYGSLPLTALVKLEQVRDATIGWILKEIEKAEKVEQQNILATRTAPSPEEELMNLDIGLSEVNNT
ncbi:MAG: hypothetical protein L6R35_004851 [Caloplaca aegaea]|nr:MAG: hypothetical protein L6R35_004851 [Caloplaca aegaea]